MEQQTYYTAKELAGLPGMPKSIKGVIAFKGLDARPIKKKDGSDSKYCEYALTSLPAATQLHLTARRQPAANLPALRQASAPVDPAALADYQRRCMDARLLLLNIIKANAKQQGVKGAINQLIKAANEFDNLLPPHVLDAVPLANARAGKTGERTLSPRTVLRWWAAWKKSGFQAVALAPETLKDAKSGQVIAAGRIREEPPWVDAFMKCWRRPGEAQQKPDLTDVLRKMSKNHPAHLVPSYDQARRHLKAIGLLEASKGRMTGKDLLSLKAYRRRLTDHMYPNDCWTADGHTLDSEWAHPIHGRPFRPEITPVLDIASRKCLSWSCDLSEKGLAVLDALRGACENYGPPVIFYTDNGKGYKNQMMTRQGTGILNRLGITPEYSRPRNPQAHGISERAHKTILVKAAKQLSTYIGRDMDSDTKRLAFKETRAAAKQGEISAILLEWDEGVAMVNRAIDEYNNRPHRSLPTYRDPATRKRVHLTPNQAYAMGIKRLQADLPKIYWPEPEGALADLYHPAEERDANQGWIELHRKMYYAPELVNFTKEKVLVAYIPSDPSHVYVRNLDTGSLIAMAKLEGNSAPYFAQSKIEMDREKSVNAKIKRLDQKREVFELERRGPAAVVIDHPPEIETKRLTSVPVPEEFEAPRAKVVAIRPEPAGFAIPESGQERWDLWCDIDARIKADDEVGEEEAQWWASFRKSGTWRAHDRIRQAAQ